MVPGLLMVMDPIRALHRQFVPPEDALEVVDVPGEFGGGELGIDLGRGDVRMAQDRTDALNRHPVRHGHRRKGVPGDVEGQVLGESADPRDPPQPVVHDRIAPYIK